MSSLVAYEDSEDESVDQEEEGGSASAQSGSCEESQEAAVWNYSKVACLQPQSCFDRETKYCSSRTVQNKQFGDAAAPLILPEPLGKISPLQTLPDMPQNFSDVLNPAKRHYTVPSGIRPYIPKRQRLAAVETVNPTEQVQGNQTRESQMLSNVSQRVKSCLAHKPGAAGIPRRLLMSLGGHQGPVNTVQWCPVPHLSHLLLSASMDKTFKVWDGAESGRCLRLYTCHSGAVRDACWTPCGRHFLTGSFDNTAVITDVETGQQIVKLDNQFKVMCAVLHPSNPEVFLCGGYSSTVKAWDSRSCKMVKVYKAGIQQTLDIVFLRGGVDFITSSDCVSRDSADRTLIAWDYQTTAKVSNQIYHERYTCPSLALHPLEESFVAQTNGNYVAMFSSQQPYTMNKRRRYEGHKVEGYAVQCEFSLDGTILASGSSTGSAHFYDYHNVRMLHTLRAHSQPCLCVSQHPVLPATAATCDWAGEIKVWH
ncbi:WD repeat-containing protein 25 isoform X1 [Mastacembelus armatus]|uniref:WD repeat-containing protein 25 isoform X1 n=1 Tax=Mastacembelus armatus TaxID=205130 RepID=UPI000E460E83|nr:WD repeat-containing protein 25 isoform X1 [Mastacembelus armatus]XP_026156467.1 WD repeat-containing protein 25 isoform X1 [Mastacembelus armatus]XP_026156475.1 WD repeat-containing protein 25 isoform X1 [Mastacembelus armatus]XP_026156483.1 WD repeat-containing protein 25 isoform X1 [Mastacembelus armatus]XP_026156492.1 WD repeat-containing protein 25 isoform X1 [Mastacembelus armatus]